MVSRPAQMIERAATWYWCVARATGRRGAMVMVLTLVVVLVRVVGGIRLASCVRSRRQRRRRGCRPRAGGGGGLGGGGGEPREAGGVDRADVGGAEGVGVGVAGLVEGVLCETDEHNGALGVAVVVGWCCGHGLLLRVEVCGGCGGGGAAGFGRGGGAGGAAPGRGLAGRRGACEVGEGEGDGAGGGGQVGGCG